MTPDVSRVSTTEEGRLRRLSNDCLVLMVGRAGIRLGSEFVRGLDGEYGHPTEERWRSAEGDVPERLSLRKSTFYMARDRDAEGEESPQIRGVALDLDSKTVDEVGIGDRLAGALNYTGGGAEMLWPQGYRDASKLKREIAEVLEGAGASSVRNFILFHATSQGTGSGVASWIVDLIRHRYCQDPERTRNLLTFTVLPSGGTEEAVPYKEFEEVSGPSYYNSVLTLNTLLGVRPGQPEVPSGGLRSLSVLLDNPAVARAYEQGTGTFPTDPAFGEVNYLMARTALALTAVLRYGPTDIGNVMVNMGEDERQTIAVPALAPVEPDPEPEAPFNLAYSGLMENSLLQGDHDPAAIYFVLRGDVDRSGIRHINDLFRDHFDLSADFFNIVERATPGFGTEFCGLVRPSGTPEGIRRVIERAEENLRAGRHLESYLGPELTEEDVRANLEALKDRLKPRDPSREGAS